MSTDDSGPLTRDIAPFGVRMPPALKDRVQAAAKANNRSMNAEIVATLEEKYPAPVVYEFDIELAEKIIHDLKVVKEKIDLAPNAELRNDFLRRYEKVLAKFESVIYRTG